MEEPKQSDFLKAVLAIAQAINDQTAEIKRFNDCVEGCMKNGALHIVVDGGNINTKGA